jgi:excisionase family DNA binding protein
MFDGRAVHNPSFGKGITNCKPKSDAILMKKMAKNRKRRTSDTALTYSVPEAGALLGLGRVAAYEAAARGDLPVLRIGGRILVPKVALQRLLDGALPVGGRWADPRLRDDEPT